MSKTLGRSRLVLLLGSIPLQSSKKVFEAVGASVGSLVKRVPDGETGERSQRTIWQSDSIRRAQGVVSAGERTIPGGYKYTQYAVKTGGSAQDVSFGPLGYAAAAIESYNVFKRVRSEGVLGKSVRFQVSLPTPLEVVFVHFIRSSVRIVWQAYERKMLDEVDEILAAIPHEDLAIQWNIAIELGGIIESTEFSKEVSNEFASAIARISDHIPSDVELGFHFCYCDPPCNKQPHIVKPKNTGSMVKLANSLAAAIKRPITWFHMPVPQERSDCEYFEPLRDLALKSGTELYLGLIHLADGLDGAKKRMDAAAQVIQDFGVASECGFERQSSETISALLDLHDAVAALQ